MKIISPRPNIRRVGNDKSNDQESDRKQRQGGVRIKVKSESLPPLTRMGSTASGQRTRTSSCNTSLERRGSSPKKRRPLLRGRVNSFRDKDTPRAAVKRRSSSTGAIGANSRLSRSNSLARRRSKLTVGKKRSGDPLSSTGANVMCFSRGSDRMTFMQDEMISPWLDEGMASDDASLMTRTIRNPRILPVPTSRPSSPETELSSSWQGRRGRRRERRSRRSSSKGRRHSPPHPCLPSFQTSTSLTPPTPPTSQQVDLQFPVIDPTLSCISDRSSAGGSTVRSARSVSREKSPKEKSSSRSQLVSQTPKDGAPASPLALSGGGETGLRGEEIIRTEKSGKESLNSFDPHQKKEAKGDKCLSSQATAEDMISSLSFDMDLQEERKTSTAMLSPRSTSPRHQSGKFPVEKSLTQERQQRYPSIAFTSLSSSPLTSEFSPPLRQIQRKTALLQQQQQQKHQQQQQQQQQQSHFRRIDFQHLRHLQLRNQQQQLQNGKMEGRRCSIGVCVWIFSLVMALSWISLYLYQYSHVWS